MNHLQNEPIRVLPVPERPPDVVALFEDADSTVKRTTIELLRKAGFNAATVDTIQEADPVRGPGCLLIDVIIRPEISARLPSFLDAHWALVFGPHATKHSTDFVFQFEENVGAISSAVEVAETYQTLPLRIRTAIGRRELERVRTEVQAQRARSVASPQPSQSILGPIVDAHVRNDASGRLDARIIADLFAIPRADLAKLLGISKQAMSATPDAERIQKPLEPFARIATLAHLAGESDFRKWLNVGLKDFDGQTPLQIIQSGNAKGVADFIQDVIEYRSPHD